MNELRELNNVSLPFALDIKGNYIYIKDADRNIKYYCPCCNQEVNTIAIDDGVDYKMPPHYRHYPNQSCSGESLAHWVYKMWLFDKGSQFYVSNSTNKKLYTVKLIDIEKTHVTDYGNYRPDLTITTTCDKIFYFELNFSNPKRSDDYFCKWSQLNNDVIEVDVKKLLKESLNNKIPTFRLIYSDGVCFDDKYNKRDIFAKAASDLYIRKEEIKRQDILNYKATWEKLDWFFESIKKYKAMKSTMEDVLNSFGDVPFEEKEYCFEIVKKITCINNNHDFRKIMNDEFFEEFSKLEGTYNNQFKNIIHTQIRKNLYYKYNFDINIKFSKDISILNSIRYSKSYELIWRKHHYPYSFYKKIKDIIDNYTAIIPKHIYFVNKINKHINMIFSNDEIQYIKTNRLKYIDEIFNLVSDDEKYNRIIDFFNSVLTEVKFNAQINIVNLSLNDMNEKLLNNNLLFEFKYNWRSWGHGSKESITLHCNKYHNNHIEINIAEYNHCEKYNSFFMNMSKEEIFNYVDSIFNSYYERVSENETSIKVLNTIYKIQHLVNPNKNKWQLNLKHIDLNHVQIFIYLKVYHNKYGYVNYYPNEAIDIKNNKIGDIYLLQLSDKKRNILIENLLIKQMHQSLYKMNKLDGIYCEERYLSKEELNEKTTTILHNEISTR